jgi:hypothetical protein
VSGTTSPPPREVSGGQSVSEPLSPGASEAIAPQEASLSGAASPQAIPAEQPDRVSRGIETPHNQEVKLDADDVASNEKMPKQAIQQSQSHDSYFRTNAASWRARLTRECGPIKYRALYNDCVRSFRAQYPMHYAGPTRTYSGRGL